MAQETVASSGTIADALRDAVERLSAQSIDDAQLEAEVLLAHELRTDRAHLLARLRVRLESPRRSRFEGMIQRRLAHEPLAYIVGIREFYGIAIACTPDALIPRPETEMLVDFTLDYLRERPDARVIDVGTGTGAIAIAVASNAPRARITATDVSAAALSVARNNARDAGFAERVEFLDADLFPPDTVFDVVVGNLPYISEHDWRELPAEIRDHEPRTALVGGTRGTEIIEGLLYEAPRHLAPGGALALEIGDAQAAVLRAAAAKSFPHAEVTIEKDLAGLDRMLVVRT